MATAAEDQEERRVSCPVCFEPFSKPKSLKCGHLLCTPCIEQMLERNKDNLIQCSICRRVSETRDLRRDFTMEENVQQYLYTKEKIPVYEEDPVQEPSQEPPVKCEICLKKQIQSKCKDCNQLLCEDCTVNHSRIGATKKHRIVTLNEAKKPVIRCIQQLISQCQERRQITEDQLTRIQTSKADIEQQAKEADDTLTAISASVVSRCNELSSVVRQRKDKEISRLSELNKGLVQLKADIYDRESILEEIMVRDDAITLLMPGFLEELTTEATGDDSHFTTMIENASSSQSTFKIVVENCTELKQSMKQLRITPVRKPVAAKVSSREVPAAESDERHGTSSETTKTNGNSLSLTTYTEKPMRKSLESTLKYGCVGISSINNHLWIQEATESRSLWIYSTEGKRVKRITVHQQEITKHRKANEFAKNFTKVNPKAISIKFCIETAQSHVITAAGEAGLLHISADDGCILNTLATGNYVHVTCHADTVYGREDCKKNNFWITQHRYNPNTRDWSMTKRIRIKHGKRLSLKFAATPTGLFFTHGDDVLQFSHEGKHVSTYATRETCGFMSGEAGDITVTDAHGNLLILRKDPMNPQILVMDSSYQCREVRIDYTIDELWDGAVDKDNNLWLMVGKRRQFHMVKFAV